MLPDSNSVQAINLPNFLLSAPDDDPKKISDAGDQKEHSQEERVSREESLRKIGKSRKRSKDKEEDTTSSVWGALGDREALRTEWFEACTCIKGLSL